MKFLRFFSMAIVAIALCASFASCSSESDTLIDQEKKMCTVKINVENIVTIEEQPMGRVEENTDLYLIAFSKGSNYNEIYAYGLFDNLNNISIQLVEGDTYSIQASAVKDGKNKVASTDDGLYGNPFLSKLTNTFIYENDDDFNYNWYFNPTLYRLKNNDSENALIAPNLEVFLGYADNNSIYEAKENGDPIAISFSRFAACSAEFKAIDMPTGYLKISISNKESNNEGVYTTEDIIVESEDQSTFQYITFGHTLFSLIANEGVPCILNLTWVKDNITEIPLIPAEVTFKRDTNYIITIKVDDSTTSTFNITPIPDYGFSSTEEIGIYGRPIPQSNN